LVEAIGGAGVPAARGGDGRAAGQKYHAIAKTATAAAIQINAERRRLPDSAVL
jgi:hypothetical protein